MNIDDLTIGQLKQIRALLGDEQAKPQSTSLRVGTKVFIRTVTFYYTGKITSITETDIILEDAAWIADTGRWSKALTEGVLSEVEPFSAPVVIMRDKISDVTEWSHALPRTVK
jgi:hypothetical protein